jgi:hypothetical protein
LTVECGHALRETLIIGLMGFLVFTPLAFLVLRLAFRLRLRTTIVAALVIGLAADLLVDTFVSWRR